MFRLQQEQKRDSSIYLGSDKQVNSLTPARLAKRYKMIRKKHGRMELAGYADRGDGYVNRPRSLPNIRMVQNQPSHGHGMRTVFAPALVYRSRRARRSSSLSWISIASSSAFTYRDGETLQRKQQLYEYQCVDVVDRATMSIVRSRKNHWMGRRGVHSTN